MTAMRVPDPQGAERSTPDTGGPEAPRGPRRAGAPRRTTSAAGQQRRSLQRDLARREASLRISRRASGPAGGISRPQPPAAAPQAPAAPIPVARPAAPPAPARVPEPVAQTQARQAAPTARLAPAPPVRRAPVARQAPAQPAPRARQAQPAPARPAQPRTQPQPRTAPQPQPQRQPRPTGIAPSTPAARATAAVASAAAAPRAALRPLVVLTGGATEVVPGRGRRLSTSAVVLSALVAIVVTIGAIVAAQIRVTQMNEQIGSDLGRISQLQQATVAQKERISSLVTSARIDDEAARQQLIEPDPVDVTYLSTGNRAQTAQRAARALRQRPVNPIGGAAAGDAKATADDAASTTPAPTGTATGVAQAGTTGTVTGAATTTTQPGATTP